MARKSKALVQIEIEIAGYRQELQEINAKIHRLEVERESKLLIVESLESVRDKMTTKEESHARPQPSKTEG